MKLGTFVGWISLALYLFGCISQGTKETSILVSPQTTTASKSQAPGAASRTPTGPITLIFRPTEVGDESAYRILMETRGELEQVKQDSTRPPLISKDSHSLELEYRETPVALENTYQLELDALHYIVLGRNPDRQREIEAGSDQLRIHNRGKEVLNVQGTAPKVDLTPRTLLMKPFASISVNEIGNIVRYSPKGQRSMRRFLQELPIRHSYAYSRIPLPGTPVEPGDSWTAIRYPPNAAGLLGLKLKIEYTLAGYEEIDGLMCAWIFLKAEENTENVKSATGLNIDRLIASMKGEAWLALKNGRVQRLVLEDSVRLSYQLDGVSTQGITNHMRYQTRLSLSVRDPGEIPLKWDDGQERFGLR